MERCRRDLDDRYKSGNEKAGEQGRQIEEMEDNARILQEAKADNVTNRNMICCCCLVSPARLSRFSGLYIWPVRRSVSFSPHVCHAFLACVAGRKDDLLLLLLLLLPLSYCHCIGHGGGRWAARMTAVAAAAVVMRRTAA